MLDAPSLDILLPAAVAGLLVLATHVPLGQMVIERGIVFIDLAVAQVAGLGVALAALGGWEDVGRLLSRVRVADHAGARGAPDARVAAAGRRVRLRPGGLRARARGLDGARPADRGCDRRRPGAQWGCDRGAGRAARRRAGGDAV